MSRLVVACAAFFTLTGSLFLATPVQAQDDSPGCVTRAEYRQVKTGMRQMRVHQIFGIRGLFLDGGAGGYARGYEFCPNTNRAVTVEYAGRDPERRSLVGSKGIRWMPNIPDNGSFSRAEYKRISKGMSIRTVHRVLDTRGELVPGRFIGTKKYARAYNSCEPSVIAVIKYNAQNGKRTVASKVFTHTEA